MNKTTAAQTGVVLITSLILLVIMTLLAVSLVRTSVIELKIGGASQIAAQNLANAEASIWAFMNAPSNRGRFFHGHVFPKVDGCVDFSADYDVLEDPHFSYLDVAKHQLCMKAVSYTHLDVYKRQVHTRCQQHLPQSGR